MQRSSPLFIVSQASVRTTNGKEDDDDGSED